MRERFGRKNCSLSSMTEHSFQGIHFLLEKRRKCNPCVRYEMSPMCQAAHNQLGAAAFSGRGDCAHFCAPLPTETDCELAVSIKPIGAFRPDDSAAAAIAEVVLKLVGSCVDIGPMPPALLRRFLLFLNSIPQQCDDDVYVSARIREQGFSSFGVEKFQMHGAFGCGSL